MSEQITGGDFEHAPAPRQIVESIVEQGRAAGRGTLAWVEALSFSRRHGWKDIEAELYSRLGVMLLRAKDPIDDASAEMLAEEVCASRLGDETAVSLRALLAGVSRAAAGTPALLRLATAFESRLEAPSAAWHARLMTGGFLDTLARRDAPLADQTRQRITRHLSDWVIEYHVTETPPDLELRTRATFRALFAGAWSDSAATNAASGLDGAFHCAVERLARSANASWFVPFLDEITPEIAAMSMPRRLLRETLFRVSELLAAARRRVYQANPGAALALTTLEEAIHRPHRRQLDPEGAGVKLDLELPGPRGFGRGTRLHVFDISRDGCLAVTEGPANFEEVSAQVAQLRRAGGRSFDVRRLNGVLRQGSVEWDVRPETALVLHDASLEREWAAIDGASVVRVTPDRATNRLWLGFHFDRVVPEVQRDIEALVYA